MRKLKVELLGSFHRCPMNFLYRLLITTAIIMATLAVMSRCAEAGELNTTWQTPVGNCDNTPLTDLAGYRVRWGSGTVQLPATATGYTVPNLTPGTWWINVAAFNMQNVESQYVAGWRTVAVEEFVTKTNKVYTFFRSNGNITLTVTPHTVPLGTVCDATQSVNGKYKVALEAVTWSGTKLTAALADCG